VTGGHIPVNKKIYIHGRKQVVWMKMLCSRIEFEQRAMKIICDSQREIFLEKNPTHHSKTKHIDVQYHFVRDMVERNNVLLEKVATLENITDRLFDKHCECYEVILVQRGNGNCFTGFVNESSEVSQFRQRRQHVG
jgi:hypothetical protein